MKGLPKKKDPMSNKIGGSNSKLESDCHIRFIDHCKLGGSIPEFCLEEEIDRKTFDIWCAKYPHMQAAKEKGKLLAEGWWMSQARKHLVVHNTKHKQTRFDSNLYKHIMGGRFGHTADREAHKRLDEIEKKIAQNQVAPSSVGAYAQEAECEPEEPKDG